MNQRPLHPPQLLVSVRNITEAEAALAGGCDVLDIKEPARGSLGMADPATIRAVTESVQMRAVPVPVSVALGEAADGNAGAACPLLPDRMNYLKLGTAGLGGGAGWGARLGEVRRSYEALGLRSADGRGESASDRRLFATQWIAVAYADWDIAHGPPPEDVMGKAGECGCAGVLIDTFSKDGGGLFDWLSVERLAALAALARSRRLLLGLAGKLQLADVPPLLAIGPQIVGIRSAACREGLRTGEIDADAVRAFRQALRAGNPYFRDLPVPQRAPS